VCVCGGSQTPLLTSDSNLLTSDCNSNLLTSDCSR
jgi:hypothetical protein